MKKKRIKPKIAGWVAVGISTLISSVWAFWGIIENFHEGWYFESNWLNLGMMMLQYLSPMLVFMSISLISIFWPRLGGGLHVLIALSAVWFFDAFSNAATFLIIIPMLGLGAMYWFGRPGPKKLATYLVVILPLLILIISGVPPAIRVSQRINNGNLNAQIVQGNEVALMWAPDGPGWPREGGNWNLANFTCQHLSEDGFTVESTPQNLWRLPTVDEAVRSMALHGQNVEGVWDAETGEATYTMTPDKESPLWNIHSQVIYWWTATELDEENAYIIVYDGKIWPRSKDFGPAYLGFRCVQ